VCEWEGVGKNININILYTFRHKTERRIHTQTHLHSHSRCINKRKASLSPSLFCTKKTRTWVRTHTHIYREPGGFLRIFIYDFWAFAFDVICSFKISYKKTRKNTFTNPPPLTHTHPLHLTPHTRTHIHTASVWRAKTWCKHFLLETNNVFHPGSITSRPKSMKTSKRRAHSINKSQEKK